jgi:L-sorbose 1-phosphate reductase
MGIAAINYILNRKDRKPALLVITDIDDERLNRAKLLFTPGYANSKGIRLVYLNTLTCDDPVKELMRLSDNKGFNDVFVFAPVPAVIEQGDSILAFDGCLNFFAGPADPSFKAPFNFYNVHYNSLILWEQAVGTAMICRKPFSLCRKALIRPDL